jgi:hexosaminidase
MQKCLTAILLASLVLTPSALRARQWECAFPAREARYVRFSARSIGTCPPWHPGAGGKAWLFVDELIVR